MQLHLSANGMYLQKRQLSNLQVHSPPRPVTRHLSGAKTNLWRSGSFRRPLKAALVSLHFGLGRAQE